MIKILITGFSGFVARHFINRLKQEQNNYSVLGIDINTPDYSLDCSKNISLTIQGQQDNCQHFFICLIEFYV